MLSPTAVRGLIGHFTRGVDLPKVCQCISTPSARLPTHLSLRKILVARAGGRGVRAGGKIRDGGGAAHSKIGATKRKTAETMTTTARSSGRRNETGGSQVSKDRAGGMYHAYGNDQEESAEESAGWSRKETEG